MATQKKDSASSRPAMSKAKTAVNSVVITLCIIGGIIGVNIIGARVFGRVDLTEDKVYKLSDASREAVRNLPDRMTVKAYISSGLQPPLNQYGRYVRDVLDEYSAASNGKLQWEAIDPLEGSNEEKQAKKEELQKYKIQKITLERITEAKLEIGSDNYLGIGFQYGGEIQSLPMVTSTEGIEYQITAIIKRLVATKKKKVGFANTEGELSGQQGLQLLTRFLDNYETVPVGLDKPIPDDIDVLVVAGPKQPFTDKAKYAIDQYLMKGKSVALFVDGMVLETPRGMNIPGMDQPRMGRANDVNLNDMLDKYGVKVRDDLILDEQNTVGPVPIEGQLYLKNHPVFIGVVDKGGGFSGHWPVTDHLKALILPFASSVELTGDLKDKKSTDVTAIAVAMTTDKKSWRQTGFFIFNPLVEPVKTAELGPFALGYALEGKLKSAFPGPPGAALDPNASSADLGKHIAEAPAGTRLLVVGDSDFISDQSLPLRQVPTYQYNLLFAVNSIDWLMHDESLITLRIKGMSARPLSITYDAKVAAWRYFNTLGIPFFNILFGLVLWRVRVARRRSIARTFAA